MHATNVLDTTPDFTGTPDHSTKGNAAIAKVLQSSKPTILSRLTEQSPLTVKAYKRSFLFLNTAEVDDTINILRRAHA